MPNYRRWYVPGGTFFFTVVTDGRRPILGDATGRQILREAIRKEIARRPFKLVAIVLLPDHLHCVWTLPPGDMNYSIRWAGIKEQFTRGFLASGGTERYASPSRAQHRERTVWQRRFWEHTCIDEDDLGRCIDYLHWNPVKHGLVDRVWDYPWSSLHRFARRGMYDPSWGTTDPAPDLDAPEWD
jgi:putative transposase